MFHCDFPNYVFFDRMYLFPFMKHSSSTLPTSLLISCYLIVPLFFNVLLFPSASQI